MLRKIIRIDEERCTGCGLCAKACHEGAIRIIDGKAKLIREDYCDGLGDCLPACPEDAISFEQREAAAYDEKAVAAAKSASGLSSDCPETEAIESCLSNWPVQIKLAPIKAPYYNKARLLIAADCTAFAYGNFHRDFIKGRVCLIGCSKLDGINYSEKLTAIFRDNDIEDISVLRMEVPCCGGIEFAVKTAVENSGKAIPFSVTVIGTDGSVIQEA